MFGRDAVIYKYCHVGEESDGENDTLPTLHGALGEREEPEKQGGNEHGGKIEG